MQIDLIFGIVVLIVSVILHEVAHGYMADFLGDPTARLQGRLTLNPIRHMDLFGSVVLPGLLIYGGLPPIGYAKPVPYNPYNLRGKHAEGLVAFAGPATNVLLAIIFGLIVRFGSAQLGPDLVYAFAGVSAINLGLALFNLVPLPPLDGSKVLSALFSAISRRLERGYETFLTNFSRMGFLPMILVILLVFNFLLKPYFLILLTSMLRLLTGASF